MHTVFTKTTVSGIALFLLLSLFSTIQPMNTKSYIKKIITTKEEKLGPISCMPENKIVTNTPKKIKFFSLKGDDITPKKLKQKKFKKPIFNCIPSPKGDKIAIVLSDEYHNKRIEFYKFNKLECSAQPTSSLLWHPDNERYMVIDKLGQALFYKYTGHNNPLSVDGEAITKNTQLLLELSKDGKLVMLAQPSGSCFEATNHWYVTVYDTKTGGLTTDIGIPKVEKKISPVHKPKIKFIDKKKIAYKEKCNTPNIKIYNLADRVVEKTITLKSDVTTFDVCKNGKYLAIALEKNKTLDQRRIEIKNIKTEKTHYVLLGHTKPIQFLAFSQDGKYIASIAYENPKKTRIHRILHLTRKVPSELIIWENPMFFPGKLEKKLAQNKKNKNFVDMEIKTVN